jgi:hypothetical protein
VHDAVAGDPVEKDLRRDDDWGDLRPFADWQSEFGNQQEVALMDRMKHGSIESTFGRTKRTSSMTGGSDEVEWESEVSSPLGNPDNNTFAWSGHWGVLG